ncbi:unnamed protein product [Angiostrongylus costaricensis]|uniref:TLC domain-containing protein n=1 Tax=Angiostrongylus costaricensis TaxID=334426 RepID=A0A0R3PMM5_ANGCS|nr:unnamed protein product [Angiostrongylus costaricensis]
MCAVLGIAVMRYLTKDVYHQAHPSLINEVDERGKLTYSYLHLAHFSLLGVYLFFMCDKIIKIVLETRKVSFFYY